MNSAKDFVIKNGVLEKYTDSGGAVVIPEGLTSIGYNESIYSDTLSILKWMKQRTMKI